MNAKKSDFDQPVMTHREMLRTLIEQQNTTNLELIKLSHVIYGNPQADILGLVGDNKNNKKYIEEDKKWKWTVLGIATAFTLFGKELFNKIFH